MILKFLLSAAIMGNQPVKPELPEAQHQQLETEMPDEKLVRVLRKYDKEFNRFLKPRHGTTFTNVFNERLQEAFDDLPAEASVDFDAIFDEVLEQVLEEVCTVYLGSFLGVSTGAFLFMEHIGELKKKKIGAVALDESETSEGSEDVSET